MTIEPNGNGMWRVCTDNEIVAIFTHKEDAETYVGDVNKHILAEREECAKLAERYLNYATADAIRRRV